MHINTSLLTTVGTVLGIVVGSAGMYFSLKDRMVEEIESAVTERVTTATRLARIDEKIKAIESDVWQLKQAPAK